MFIDLKAVATDLCSKLAHPSRGTTIGVLATLVVAVGLIAMRILFKPPSERPDGSPLLIGASYASFDDPPSSSESSSEEEPGEEEYLLLGDDPPVHAQPNSFEIVDD